MNALGQQKDKGKLKNPKRFLSQRRLSRGISQSLSPEAKLAMTQASEECPVKPKATESGNNFSSTVPENNINDAQDRKENRKLTFGEAYERLVALRLTGDITTETEKDSESSSQKRSIGGGKLGNAMELVETFMSGQDDVDTDTREHAELDRAKLISLEKCLVWFDVQREYGDFSSTLSEQNFTKVTVNTI